MSEYIPIEIQFEIIQRLPAKSAVRFRLVSKPWNSYIGSSEFIVAHHRRNIHQPQPHRLLAWFTDPLGEDAGRYVTVIDDDNFYQQDFTPKAPRLAKKERELPASRQYKILTLSRVIDCSLGLLCLHGIYCRGRVTTKMAIIWNPLIRKSVRVVLPYSSNSKAVGFGVCPVTFDPTIVKISHGDPSIDLPWEVKVFTLSSGTWKSLGLSNLPRKTVYLQSSNRRSQVVIDRFIYWDAYEWRIVAKDAIPENINLIVSFDMTTHEFELIDLPDSLSHPFHMKLSKIQESMVVVEYISDSVEDLCTVWVMEDIVTKSFSRLYTIEVPMPSWHMVLGFRKSGEAIMKAHYAGEIVGTIEVYEPCSEHISKLGIYGDYGSFFVSSYMETLLLLDQSDCHIYSDAHE
uniref:putative F-box protein At3g52320 n=1 Tax=Erigeron canadensis TaxID=72917 RepID=UPI001CB8D2BE|nr:putative F-box protein At3g52320 [Erigeron canadensis]